MTTPRIQTVKDSKSATPMPPVGGGSTTQIRMGLHRISRDELKRAPILANKSVTGSRFGKLRETVENYSLESQQLVQQLDENINIMKSKESQKLGTSLSPFRTEANEYVASFKTLKEDIRSLEAHFEEKLNEYHTRIKGGNARPREIDPIINELERTRKTKMDEFEKLKRNDVYLVSKMQSIVNQVNFQVAAFRSRDVRGDQPTPRAE